MTSPVNDRVAESLNVMPVEEHERAMAALRAEHESTLRPVQRSIKNQRDENRQLIRQLQEERSQDPEAKVSLKRQLELVQSHLARSINRGQRAERELAALREAAQAALPFLAEEATHRFMGECPELGHLDSRDTECGACRALDALRAALGDDTDGHA